MAATTRGGSPASLDRAAKHEVHVTEFVPLITSFERILVRADDDLTPANASSIDRCDARGAWLWISAGTPVVTWDHARAAVGALRDVAFLAAGT
jgi:hypothetical protein